MWNDSHEEDEQTQGDLIFSVPSPRRSLARGRAEDEQTRGDLIFSRRNRLKMAFWSGVLLVLWGFLFGAGVLPAIDKLEHTPEDPSGYVVVRYDRSKPVPETTRAATTSDMFREKYRGIAAVAFFALVAGGATFLLVASVIDYRTRFLGWAIQQLPRNAWNPPPGGY
ncbi:hypothetical protein [Gemmata sp.]|uniref:hypothetical protein n=1 Tax=Gemmata sp. TaxID=1914242 RepID=UPI003F7044E8